MKVSPIIKQKIENWLAEPYDFLEGLNLLRKVSRKRQLISELREWGVKGSDYSSLKMAKEKLISELKLAFSRVQSSPIPELSDKKYERDFAKLFNELSN